ncbi:MAG: 30S ribosomal protein S19e [Candidatus Diapherotrites archaeon]
MAVFDVPPSELIKGISREFKGKIAKPAYTDYVKTGAQAERAPHSRDWFFERAASILYRVYKDGPVGVNSLRTYYGNRKSRGVRPHHFVKASGKIIRDCIHALEKEGYVKKEKKGRVITGKGESFLNAKSKEVLKEWKEKANKEKELKLEREKMDESERKAKEELKKMQQHEKQKHKAEEDKKHHKEEKKHEAKAEEKAGAA